VCRCDGGAGADGIVKGEIERKFFVGCVPDAVAIGLAAAVWLAGGGEGGKLGGMYVRCLWLCLKGEEGESGCE
jgi:hypothetical protein